MKLFVALGLLAVAFAAQNWETRSEEIRDVVFKAGKQYNFKFDGQIASGLPMASSSQNSASRIESLVSLKFEDDRQVLLKINKIRVGSAQREVVDTEEVQSFELFKEIELTEEQKENFLLPVRFRYEDGLVSEIEFDREEPTWTANIKRAILNMLQVNLSKKSRTDKSEMSRLLRDTEEKEWEKETFFTTQEKTLEGDCETTYTVVPSGEEKIHVSKSLNFEKCKKRVDIRYNLRFGEECLSCESKYNRDETNTVSSTVLDFDLTGTPSEHLIREVRLRSQYVFTPFSGEEQLMGTYVCNKLRLLSVDSDVEKIRGPKSENKEEIVYSTEWEERLEKFRMTGDESLLKKSPYHWMEKKMDLAEKSIESLRVLVEKEDKDEPHKPETVHEWARLVEILRIMTVHEIEKIEKMMKKDEILTSFFYDALAEAGTYPCVSRLVEGIISRRLTHIETAKCLKRLLSVRTPSEKMIHELLRLSKEDIARTPLIRQSLWLSIGAVMHGVCGETNERFAVEMRNKEEICPRELKEKYVREMKNFFEQADSHYDKILALKVFANSGIDLIVFPLEKIIKDRREEESVRLSAIESLRKLTRVMPRKIQSILLPLFKQTGESVEMRVAAFHHLMHTMPSRVIIDQITLHLENEPSTRVYSYVLSTLESLVSSSLPCEKDLARDVEVSLKHVNRQSPRFVSSRSLRTAHYSHEYMTGADLIISHLASNNSILPSEVSASLSTLVGGEWYSHLAEIGFSQENINVLISKIYELVKENQDEIEEIMVRGKRSSEMRPVEILKNLMKKMGIQERRSSSKHSAAIVYMRIKDMDYVFLPIEEKYLVDAVKMFLKNGVSDVSSFEKILSRGYSVKGFLSTFVYEKTRAIATTMGMPLDITWKMPTILSLDAQIKASIEKRTVSLTLRPKLASTHIVHCETRSPIFSQGVKMIHSATLLTPIETDLKWESESRSVLSLNFRLPETESVRVLRVQTRPVCYIRHENRLGKHTSALEKTIFLQNQPRHEINREYGEKIFGLRFAVRGNMHRGLVEKMENGVAPIFIGENDIEMRMEKTETTPREYSIRVSFDSLEKKNKMMEDIELDSFYPTSHSHFNVHDDETVEKSRRSEFNDYLRTLSSSSVYNHRVHVTLDTRGSSVERRASGELRTVCDETLSYCKWIVSISRSPLLEGENREWELVSTIQTLLPSRMASVTEIREQKHREILALLSTKWGSNEKNTVTLRLQLDQSPSYIKHIERLVENKKMQSVEQATRLNQLKISADYDLPLYTQTQFARLSTLVKAYYPLSFEIETPSETESRREGRLLAKLTVEPQTWRFANFSLETPRERLTLESVRLPFRPTWFSLEKKGSVLRTFSPICEVSDSRMKTFDEIIYRAPLTTCYSVLAKDCSEEPRFAVLLMKINKNEEEKKMKIITREHTIEMEMNKDEIECSVNGKIIKEKKLNEYGLEKRGDLIIFENDDIFVKFDGFKAEIKMNEYFKAKQCGLCGHFDGEKKGEFRKADDEETEDLEEFHRSFLLKNEECEIEESRIKDKKNYKKFDYEGDSEESREWEYETEKKEKKQYNFEKEDDDTVEPIEKTRVIEKHNRICFSKTPVPECPKKTFEKDDETKDIKVHFTCLDRSSSEARRFLRESRREVLSIGDLPNSFVETLTVPKYCVVY